LPETRKKSWYKNTGNKSKKAKFKYFVTTETNKYCIHEGVKARLNMRNACHYWVQNLSSFHVLSKNLKIRTYITVVPPSI
jgi:hypothetical protein